MAELMRAVALPSIRVTDEPSLLRALEVYELERLDFAEACLVALAEATGVDAIASFDRSRREHRAARAVNATVIAIAFRACDSEARIPAAARSRQSGSGSLSQAGRVGVRMHRSMSRHVAYVEAYGVRTPDRRQRQREIISSASAQYRPLPDAPPGSDPSLIAGFAFSTRTSGPDALARLVGILDAVDPGWRSYVRVSDGWERKDDSQPQLADPPFAASAAQDPRPRLGLLDRLRALIGR